MRAFDPSQPLIYSHIPKCAGSSVVKLLRTWFKSSFHQLIQDETQNIVLPRMATQDADGNWLPNVKIIQGHFDHGRGYGLPYFYPEINQYFTIYRDPFDMLVSMYFFVKGKSKQGEFWNRGRQVDIRETFSDVQDYLRYYPRWMFDHLPVNLTMHKLEDKLRERFIYIGLFEDLQTTVDKLAIIFGKETMELPRFNVSEYDEPIPEHLRGRFYQDYPLLKRIHDFAVANYRTVQCL